MLSWFRKLFKYYDHLLFSACHFYFLLVLLLNVICNLLIWNVALFFVKAITNVRTSYYLSSIQIVPIFLISFFKKIFMHFYLLLKLKNNGFFFFFWNSFNNYCCASHRLATNLLYLVFIFVDIRVLQYHTISVAISVHRTN